MYVFLLIFSSGLVIIKPTGGNPLPSPQLIVKSQSNLFSNQPGRQVDLSDILPTEELFWLNLEEGYFACQLNESEKFLKIFRISRLCDYKEDCYKGSDELQKDLRCSSECDPPCLNGVCLSSRPESQCHCDDGWGGKLCEEPDLNECKYRPCSLFAQCTNTLGSFYCTCRPGYSGDGFECRPDVEKDSSEYDLINEVVDDEFIGNPGLKTSICTYNGVEYFEGEEVFTQRRCSDCTCRNGEIQCEKVVCDSPPSGNCKAVTIADKCCPEYACENMMTTQGSVSRVSSQISFDLDESQFDDVIQNVKDLIGGLNRSDISTRSPATPTPISILDFVVNGAKKPVTVLSDAPADEIGFEITTQTMFADTKVKDGSDKNMSDNKERKNTQEVIQIVKNIVVDLDKKKDNTKDQAGNDKNTPCTKDCIFSEDNAIVFTSTLSSLFAPESTTEPSSQVPRMPVTKSPGVVQLSITPSPSESSFDFEPINPSTESLDTTTEDIASITVTNKNGIKIQDDKVKIEINFPGDYSEDREDDISVKFTFEEENEIDDTVVDIKDREDVFLYDVVTDSTTTTDKLSPPTFDSLPIFEKDKFDPKIHNTFYEENIETDYTASNEKQEDTTEETFGDKINRKENTEYDLTTERNKDSTKDIPDKVISIMDNIPTDGSIIQETENQDDEQKTLMITTSDMLLPISTVPTDENEFILSVGDNSLKPARPRYNLVEPEIVNDEETDEITEVSYIDKTLSESSTQEPTVSKKETLETTESMSRNNVDDNILSTTIIVTLPKTQTESSTSSDDEKSVTSTQINPSMIIDSSDKPSGQDLLHTKIAESTVISTTLGNEYDDNTPGEVVQLDDGLATPKQDDEPTLVTDKTVTVQEEVTDNYTDTPHSFTSTENSGLVEKISTSTDSNLLRLTTGFDDRPIVDSQTTDIFSSTKIPASGSTRVTVSEEGSGDTTFTTPTLFTPTENTYGENVEPTSTDSYSRFSTIETRTSVTINKTVREKINKDPPSTSKEVYTELGEDNLEAIDTKLDDFGIIRNVEKIPPPTTKKTSTPKASSKEVYTEVEEDIVETMNITLDDVETSTNVEEGSQTTTTISSTSMKKPELDSNEIVGIQSDDRSNYQESEASHPEENANAKMTNTSTQQPSTYRPATGQVNNGAQPRRDDSVFEECIALNLPDEFFSFNGNPPNNIADCSWDFFGCTKKFGKWPDNKVCCEDRFSQCSMLVMGMGTNTDSNQSVDKTESKEDPTKKFVTENSANTFNSKDLLSKESRLNDETTEIFLIHCIWKYMNCSDEKNSREKECREEFSTCSDNVDEESNDVQGLPDIPGFDVSSLKDSGNDFAACILSYYNCSDSRFACKNKFNDCSKNLPVKVSDVENQGSQGSGSTFESGDRYTPNISSGSGKVPEIQCTWSFFMCKKDSATCKDEHDDCLNGNIFDNKICAGVAKHPERYLVPHPTDCTKFYSCQRQGWGGWIANPMDCPVTTGFDKSLMICNYINSLPRCKKDNVNLLKSDSQAAELIAKQTNQQLEVHVGELGYFAARSLNSYSNQIQLPSKGIIVGIIVFLRTFAYN